MHLDLSIPLVLFSCLSYCLWIPFLICIVISPRHYHPHLLCLRRSVLMFHLFAPFHYYLSIGDGAGWFVSLWQYFIKSDVSCRAGCV